MNCKALDEFKSDIHEVLLGILKDSQKPDRALVSETYELIFFVPTYNSEKTLRNSLNSMLNQQEVKVFIVILDDHSTDRTMDILLNMEQQHHNILVFRNHENLGQLFTTNLAREIARNLFPNSSYLAMGSDHDLWESNFAQIGLSRLKENSMSYWYVPSYKRYEYSDVDCIHRDYTETMTLAKIKEMNCRCIREGSVMKNGLGSQSVFRRIKDSNSVSAGSWIYGIEKIRVDSGDNPMYWPCVGPDQLFLISKLVEGPYVSSTEITWHRVQFSKPNRERTLLNLFGSDRSVKYRPGGLGKFSFRLHQLIIAWTIGKNRPQKKILIFLIYLNLFFRKSLSPLLKAKKLASRIRSKAKKLASRIRSKAKKLARTRIPKLAKVIILSKVVSDSAHLLGSRNEVITHYVFSNPKEKKLKSLQSAEDSND
jgi:glycosyltransferase involved in cell wall biosynthesis